MESTDTWRSKKFRYLSLEEAHKVVMKALKDRGRRENVSVFQAYRRVLAEEITSDVDIPPHIISHFDGYAVRAEDTRNAAVRDPTILKVAGATYLGEESRVVMGKEEAAYVSTGSRLPYEADAVIPVESTTMRKDVIEVRHPVLSGENVIPPGLDVKKGEILFRSGHVVRSQDVKLLVDIHRWRIRVFRKPIVAIASIGSELTSMVEEADVKKFNSHSLMISTLVEEAGGEPVNMGVAPDDFDAVEHLISEALRRADIVVTIAGASIGERDHVWKAAKQLKGAMEMIRGIKILPGRVTSMVIVEDKPVVMLPGHVQSTLAGFYTILLPVIRLARGLTTVLPHMTLKVKMAQDLAVKRYIPFEKLRFVRVTKKDGEYIAQPVTGDSSMISVVAKADGFIIIQRGKPLVRKGEEVEVHLMDGLFPLL